MRKSTDAFIDQPSEYGHHHIIMYSLAGVVKRSRSIIVPDIGITVSVSHQISDYIEMSVPKRKRVDYESAVHKSDSRTFAISSRCRKGAKDTAEYLLYN